MINRIDDRPALDVLKEDIREILARNLDQAAGYIHAGRFSSGGILRFPTSACTAIPAF